MTKFLLHQNPLLSRRGALIRFIKHEAQPFHRGVIMADIITIKGLTKRFGDFVAVNSISLKVKEGEIFGFLGPNGAGKTTTISMMTTLMKPTSGSAKIAGHDLLEEGVEIRSIIGVVPQSFSLFPELTAEENLAYIGKLYGMSRPQIEKRSTFLLKTVQLNEQRDRISGVFSGGMKQRLSLAASIMSDPKILFMDEPTTGLDPQSRIAMRELTKTLNKSGMTIIYTTHDMDEAEKICDTITIMDKGNIIANGTSDELKKLSKNPTMISLVLEKPTKDIVAQLSKLDFVSTVQTEGESIILTAKKQIDVCSELIDFLKRRNHKVLEININKPSLEDVFIRLTSKELRD